MYYLKYTKPLLTIIMLVLLDYSQAANLEKCRCNPLGTDLNLESCNSVTGQCPCLPNVIGLRCNECFIDHWKIASGTGCEPCECDPIGSLSSQCNEYTGQCRCKSGHSGRICDQINESYY